MTMQLVARRNGLKYFKGTDANDREVFSVIPEHINIIPCDGFFNSYKACEVRKAYNVFRILK